MAEPESARGEFDRRHAAWIDLHRHFGPARSFSYAWRLPDLARREGAPARARASLALAGTLFVMGRFAEALDALPDGETGAYPALAAPWLFIRACCLGVMDENIQAADCLAAATPLWTDRLDALQAQARFAFVLDTPDIRAGADYLGVARKAGAGPLARASLLTDWAQPDAVGPGASHAALAWLRRHARIEAAEGEALHAEARFRQAPAEALVWLDHALEQAGAFGLHWLRPRLLHRKSRALDAGGQLGEADRFLKLAWETARRQGAWRSLRNMAG